MARRRGAAPAKEISPIGELAETVSAGGTPSVLEDIHEAIMTARNTYCRNPMEVTIFRAYTRGEQRNVLSEAQQKVLQGLLHHEFSDNVCYQIVAEARDRLQFLGWICEDADVQKFLNNFYIKAKVSDKQNRVHFDTLRDGNSVSAVNWDNKRLIVQLYPETWWNGYEGLFVLYDADENPIVAVKEWIIDKEGTRRRLLWFEDTIVRLISADNGNTWDQHILPGDGGSWPLNWTQLDDTPLHIPFVHFPNGARDTGIYGVSELYGGVIAFQDQLNGLQWDLSGAGRLTAFQMITASGIALAKDPKDATKYLLPEVGPGQFLWSTSPHTKFGAIGAGDISQLVKLYMTKLQRVSQMTRTPYHRISGGDWPSGEALFRSEQPAIGKADAQKDKLNPCWIAIGHKAVEIYNRFGSGLPDYKLLDEEKLVTAVFLPTERRDPLSRSVIVNNLRGTISIAESLRIMGYDATAIAKVIQEMKDETVAGIVDVKSQYRMMANVGAPPDDQPQGSAIPGSGQTPQSPRPNQGPSNEPAKRGGQWL